ncbi:YadA-like family protein [Shewanella sediminis]|nr:YadA-like family protein [Shewanella sediminis]
MKKSIIALTIMTVVSTSAFAETASSVEVPEWLQKKIMNNSTRSMKNEDMVFAHETMIRDNASDVKNNGVNINNLTDSQAKLRADGKANKVDIGRIDKTIGDWEDPKWENRSMTEVITENSNLIETNQASIGGERQLADMVRLTGSETLAQGVINNFEANESLRKEGVDEAARLDERIEKINESGYDDAQIRADGEKAINASNSEINHNRYNIVENQKEIVDLTGAQALLRSDGEKAIEAGKEYIDDRIEKINKSGYDDTQIREEGRADSARLDKRIDEVASKGYDDSVIRNDADKALTSLSQDVDSRLNSAVSQGGEEVALLNKRIDEVQSNGGNPITEEDIEAARKEAKDIANKAVEDAAASIDTAALEKAIEGKIDDAISKIDTDAALKKFKEELDNYDREIRGDGAKQVARLDKRIDANAEKIDQNSKKIEALENRIDGFQDYMNENAAMTNALSGLPQPYNVGKMQVGVGLGFASDKKAVAVGFGYRATEAVVIRGGVSKSAGDRGDVQGNIAVGYEF